MSTDVEQAFTGLGPLCVIGETCRGASEQATVTGSNVEIHFSSVSTKFVGKKEPRAFIGHFFIDVS